MKNIIIGIITGFISGMFSSGGGLILVPVFTYFFKMQDRKSRATALFLHFTNGYNNCTCI